MLLGWLDHETVHVEILLPFFSCALQALQRQFTFIFDFPCWKGTLFVESFERSQSPPF